MTKRPDFHLRRVETTDEDQIPCLVPVGVEPQGNDLSRRGFLGAGLTATTLMGFLSSTASGADASGKIRAHTKGVMALAFSPNSLQLASAGADGTVKIWEIPAGKQVRGFVDTSNTIQAIAFLADDKLWAAGFEKDKVHIWNVSDSGPPQTSKVREDRVWASTFDLAKKHLITASLKEMMFRSLDTGDKASSISFAKGEWARGMGASLDGQFVACGTNDKLVRIWKVSDAQQLKALHGHLGPVHSIAFAPSNAVLFSGSADSQIHAWRKQAPTAWGADGTLPRVHAALVSALTVSPDGKYLASGDSNGVVILWELANRKLIGQLFDPAASDADGFIYDQVDVVTGRTVTYTLPCGSPIPAGATCVCNCVPGTYRPVASTPQVVTRTVPRRTTSSGRQVASVPQVRTAPPTVRSYPTYPTQPTYPIRPMYPIGPMYPIRPAWPTPSYGGSYTICTCNLIRVCQAHRLLHHNPEVRVLARESLILSGMSAGPYLEWAASVTHGPLQERIVGLWAEIRQGLSPDPRHWLPISRCLKLLDSKCDVITALASQFVVLRRGLCAQAVPESALEQASETLQAAAKRPWYIRYGIERFA